MELATWRDTQLIERCVVTFNVFLAFRKTNESSSNGEVQWFTHRRVAQFQPTCSIRPVHAISLLQSQYGFPRGFFPLISPLSFSLYICTCCTTVALKKADVIMLVKSASKGLLKALQGLLKALKKYFLLLADDVELNPEQKENGKRNYNLIPAWLWTKYG